MGPYDSPTFLSRKDKLLMGMTLQQFGIVFGGGFVWLMVALAVDQPLTNSLLMFGPAHGVTVAMLMIKPAGMSIPVYVILAVRSFVTAPVYHVETDVLRDGLQEWFKDRDLQADKEVAGAAFAVTDIGQGRGRSAKFLGALLFFRRKAVQQSNSRASQEARAIARVETEHRAGEAVNGVQRTLRSMIRLLFRGRV